MRRGGRAMSLAAGLLVVLAWAGALEAQTLDEVERLAMSGQAEDARVMLSQWWDADFEDAPRLDKQKGLWLRGLLTVDPTMAELDFQRLVVEYPGGRYTSEALVRLGGAAEARGEMSVADRYFRTLLRDYPGSRYETLARAWIRDHPDAWTEPGPAVATRAQAPDSAGAPPESSAGDSVSTPATTPPDPPSAAGSGVHAVQLGAFSSERRAQALLERAGEAGLDVRLVEVDGSPLFRVRLGRFENEADAEAARDRVVEAGFEAAVVKNADRESSGA